MLFHGIVDSSVESDLRALYVRGDGLTRVIYALLGLVCSVLFYLETYTAPRAPLYGSIVLGVGSILLLAASAGALHWAWWHWWRRAFGVAAQPLLDGTVTSDGLQSPDASFVVSWNDVVGAKVSDRAALLYVSKSYAHPLHASFFPSVESWHAAQALILKRVRNNADFRSSRRA